MEQAAEEKAQKEQQARSKQCELCGLRFRVWGLGLWFEVEGLGFGA